jgi:hypothetical protein
VRSLVAVGALIVALVAGFEAARAHDALRLERIRTDHLVRILSKRINHIEFWHGWPPSWGRASEAVRDHDHLRESKE